jgi:hypothetical protein
VFIVVALAVVWVYRTPSRAVLAVTSLGGLPLFIVSLTFDITFGMHLSRAGFFSPVSLSYVERACSSTLHHL